MKQILFCPLCKKPLIRFDSTYKCINRHSYDISRKGFINLLLPNQHHSKHSGDEKEMVLARVRFLNLGKYDILRNLIKNTLEKFLAISNNLETVILDAGCGDGYYTVYYHKELSSIYKIYTYGVDLSKQAINESSIRCRNEHLDHLLFIIGNMNYLPIEDESVDFIINSFAKIDENEFLRVLKKGKYFFRILPGKNHLLGLKQVLYENVRLNEEKEKYLKGFNLIDEMSISDYISLNQQEIKDLFMMTPYYYKSSNVAKERLMKLDYLETKIEFKILVYQKN